MDLVEALNIVHDLASQNCLEASERANSRHNETAALQRQACGIVHGHIDLVMSIRDAGEEPDGEEPDGEEPDNERRW
jgi:hypothetical protein